MHFPENLKATDTSSVSSEAESLDDVWTITDEQRDYYIAQFKTMQSETHGVITGEYGCMFALYHLIPNEWVPCMHLTWLVPCMINHRHQIHYLNRSLCHRFTDSIPTSHKYTLGLSSVQKWDHLDWPSFWEVVWILNIKQSYFWTFLPLFCYLDCNQCMQWYHKGYDTVYTWSCSDWIKQTKWQENLIIKFVLGRLTLLKIYGRSANIEASIIKTTRWLPRLVRST